MPLSQQDSKKKCLKRMLFLVIFHQIPLNPPFPKEEMIPPPFLKRGEGGIFYNSIQTDCSNLNKVHNR